MLSIANNSKNSCTVRINTLHSYNTKSNYMKHIRLFSATVLLTATLFCAPTQLPAQTNLPTMPYIEVRASATRKVTPDELYLKITIKESDYKGKKSLQQMQEKMVGTLKKCNIDVDENLTVMTMGSSIKLKNLGSKVKTLTEAVYILKLSDAETMQKVITQLETDDISNITLTDTKYSQKEQLESQLGAEAVKLAQKRAIKLAEAVGQEIGKAIYINTWSMNEVVAPRNYKMMARSAVAEDAAIATTGATPISITENEYSVEVNIRFELK